MTLYIILFIIVGSVLTVFIFFVIKSLLGPRKIEYLAALLDQDRKIQAIKVAKRIISKEPRNVDAHYLLGQAYLDQNNPELGLVELRTINLIGRFGNYCREIPFRKKMGELFIKFNQNEEALKEYLLLIQLEPFESENFFQAGYLFEKRGNTENAIAYFVKAIKIDKAHPDAHFHLGTLLLKKKKVIEARAEFELALQYNPLNYKANYYLGKIEREEHDFVNALKHFGNAQKDPELKLKAIVERGACYMNMNNHQKAIPELIRAIKLAKDDSVAEVLYGRFFLASCYEKNRDIENALEQWELIFAKNPTFKNVGEKLSQYQELRMDDKVKDYLTSSTNTYINICKSVISSMNLNILETDEIPNGCQIIAEEAQNKWRNARKLPKIIRFYRIPEVIRDATVRSLHDEMRKLNINRGLIFTSSQFSRLALEYAETRPIDLFDKDMLIKYLKGANIVYSDT